MSLHLTRLDLIDICNALGLANESYRLLAADAEYTEPKTVAAARELLTRNNALIGRLREALDRNEPGVALIDRIERLTAHRQETLMLQLAAQEAAQRAEEGKTR